MLTSSLALACAAILPVPRQDTAEPADRKLPPVLVEAGGWTVRIESEIVSPPMNHVMIHHQRILRRGPGEREFAELFEEEAPGTAEVRLRENGLLLVQPVRGGPRFYFPGSLEAVDLRLPPPAQWDLPFGAYLDVGDTWFFDDVLFYSRDAFPGHLLVGFVRFDVAKKVVVESRLCLEVVHQEQDVAREASVESALRVGEHILWVNTGHQHSYPVPDTPWKTRKLRALSLATCEPVPIDSIPEASVAASAGRIRAFLEDRSRRVAPELEIWALESLARVGSAEDAPRLRELSAGREGDVKRAYEAAVRALESKPRKP